MKSQRRSKTRPTAGLDLDSMWNSPSLRGMLSFLEVSPEERRQMLDLRQARDAQLGYPVLDVGAPDVVERPTEIGPQPNVTPQPVPIEDSSHYSDDAKKQSPKLSDVAVRIPLQPIDVASTAAINWPEPQNELTPTAVANYDPAAMQKTGNVLPHELLPSDLFELSPTVVPEVGTAWLASEEQETASQDTLKQGTLDNSEGLNQPAVRVSSDVDFDLWSLAELGRVPSSPELRRMVLAQDVHTPGEELLYGKMWSRARPVEGKPFRVLTVGIKKLTAMVGLSKTDNCKNNLQGLVRKLAIDDLGVAPNPNHGHVYRIWDQSAILQRRRERGLTHYFRVRRAVVLVNPNSPTISSGIQNYLALKQGTSSDK